MNHFAYRSSTLFAEDVALTELAGQVGTPVYVYSTAQLEQNYRAFAGAFPETALTAFSVKSNGNLAVLRTLARLGAGADVVSGGELKKALFAGICPNKIVFSGVGKTLPEMQLALSARIRQFNVESEPELEALNDVAVKAGTRARIAVRVNPDVDARTNAKISTGTSETKFGVPLKNAREVYARAGAMAGIEIVGVDVHIGSQVTEIAPFETAFIRVAELIDQLRRDGHAIRCADLGGGLGVPYSRDNTPPPDLEAYARLISRVVTDLGIYLILEPGRVIAADAGVLLSRTIYIKRGERKNFLVIDAGMNDFMRPALYDAYHEIVPVTEPPANAPVARYDVVGPVCETTDLFGRDRDLPQMKSGDLVAVLSAGAYGAVMASAYNARPPAAEVLTKGNAWSIVRRRISDDEFAGLDTFPNWLEG